MEEKYIKLLLNKCISTKKSKILFISYEEEVEEFVLKIENMAKNRGIEEIYLDKNSSYKDHDILKNNNLKELEEGNFFDKSIWDEYAKRDASFLIIDTELPHLMDDIESDKISLMVKKRRESRPLYRKMVENCTLSWCIASYPSKSWAKEVFKDSNDSYNDLLNAIYKACMVDTDNPSKCWEEQIDKVNKIIKYLNSLNLRKLYYKNSLGTNLTIYLPEDYNFESAKDNDVIVNMPSYEIFASPIYNKTEGIVYSSMPLYYGGSVIDKFWLKFKDGKVVEYDAKSGKELLKSIIENDSNSAYLGECALVENDSPISNMNLVFGTTLLDENASCHLALGSGFCECLKNGTNYTEEELLEKGINVSKTHVDFMIGTKDLSITGVTLGNEEVVIFENGNFSRSILENAYKDIN